MYMILLILFVNNLVRADDFSEETKYIDLLPDKEKQQFLERITRRIFNQLQSKDARHTVSGEVSEKQLNEHDEFIKKVFQEESTNLRKNDDVNNDHNNKAHAKDETLDKKEKILDVIDDDHVDLTKRAGRRYKRNNLDDADRNAEFVHVRVGSKEDLDNIGSRRDDDDSDVKDIQIKYFRRNKAKNDNENKEIKPQESNSQVTQMFDFEAEEAKGNDEDNSNNPTQSTEIVGDKVNNNENIGDITVENTSKKPTQSAEIIEGDKTAGANNDSNNNFGFTQKIYDSYEKDSKGNNVVTESISTTASDILSTSVKTTEETTEKLFINDTINTEIKNNKNETNPGLKRSFSDDVSLHTIKELDKSLDGVKTDKTLEDNIKNLETKTPSVLSTVEITTLTPLKEITEENIDIESTSTKNKGLTIGILRSKPEFNNVEEMSSKEIIGDKLFTILPYKDVSYNPMDTNIGKHNNNNQKLSEKDIISNGFNNLKLKSKSDKVAIDKEHAKTNIEEFATENNKTQNAADKRIYSLANDIIKVLRKQVPEPSSNDNKLKGRPPIDEVNKPKEYQVYEVPIGQNPFILRGPPAEDNNENPYYVPIYNYSPNNAYYDPYNRLGPNADDDTNNTNENNGRIDQTDLETQERDKISDEDEKNKESYVDTKSSSERLLRSYNNHENQRFKFGATKSNKHKQTFKLNMPVVIKYPKFTDLFTKSNDYLDIDYYFGIENDISSIRSCCKKKKKETKIPVEKTTKSIFPDSHESDHPFNSGNLKSHMSSVRQFLFNQKRFGKGLEPDFHNKSRDELALANVKENEENNDNLYLRTRLRTKKKKIYEQEALSEHSESSEAERDLSDSDEIHLNFFNVTKNYVMSFINKTAEIISETFKQYETESLRTDSAINSVSHESDHPFNSGNLKSHMSSVRQFLFNQKRFGKGLEPDFHNKSRDELALANVKENEENNDNLYLRTRLRTKKKKIYEQEALSEHSESSEAERDLSDSDEIHFNFFNITKNYVMSFINKTAEIISETFKQYETESLRTDSAINSEEFISVLKDMVRNGARGLKQYNWVGTTVDIQAALLKLMEMTDALKNGAKLPRQDMQLFKYITYLKKITKPIKERDTRMKKGKKNKRKESVNMKNWVLRMLIDEANNKYTVLQEDLDDFSEFLNNLQYYLYDLHVAIKEIASITKYKKQRWLENLKELYLDTTRKNLLELLLHLSTTRFLDLVENSAKNGLEDDFLKYVLKNEKTLRRTKDEMMFIVKIIEELKSLN